MQVGLFNVMEERDIQIKGYRVRLPLDVLVVASANPGGLHESRAHHYAAQGSLRGAGSHPLSADRRPSSSSRFNASGGEAARPRWCRGRSIVLPEYMVDIVGEVTFEARSSPDISQSSGVSVRMTISNYETLAANAGRRSLRTR